MAGSPFLELLEKEVVIGDGAMGTMLHARGVPWDANFDHLNLIQPDLVQSIHRDYLAAGARLIETNTFGANAPKLSAVGLSDQVRAINLAGAQLARALAPEGVFVAGSVGPLPRARRGDEGLFTDDEKRAAFREQMEALIEGGVDVLILETFTQRGDLRLALQVAKAVSDVPVVCQMAFPERLREEEEHQIIQTLLQLRDEGADVIGGNCGFGPLHLLRAMEHIATHHDALLSAFPNTGFPHYLEGRYVYLSEPEYFADNAVRFAEIGVNLIGGCCGTTPEHIRLVAERLRGRAPTLRRIEPLPPPRPAVEIVAPPPAVPNLLDRLGQEKIIIVELDPPRGSLNYEKVIGSARILKDEGVHAISIAENPLASLRMSSFVLSYLIQRETGRRPSATAPAATATCWGSSRN
jgi:homocysteine S-methyltransferase